MAPHLGLYARSEAGQSSNALTPTIIIGIALACAIGLGAALWLGIRFWKKQAAKRREGNRQSAFLNVRGVVKDAEKQALPRCVFCHVSVNVARALTSSG